MIFNCTCFLALAKVSLIGHLEACEGQRDLERRTTQKRARQAGGSKKEPFELLKWTRFIFTFAKIDVNYEQIISAKKHTDPISKKEKKSKDQDGFGVWHCTQGHQNKRLWVAQRARRERERAKRERNIKKDYYLLLFFTAFSHLFTCSHFHWYVNCSEDSYWHECTAEDFIFNLMMSAHKIQLFFFDKQLA